MIRDLFEEDVRDVRLAPGAMLLGGFARRFEAPCVTPCDGSWRSRRSATWSRLGAIGCRLR
jgi:hypothetical protein